MKKALAASAVAFVLTGCGPSQEAFEQEQAKAQHLADEVAQLKAELNELKFGPATLLKKAEAFYQKGQDADAQNTLNELLEKHPLAAEKTAATLLLEKVKARRNAEAQAREQALQKSLAAMQQESDEIKGITWFSHQNSPSRGDYLSAYFGSTAGSAEGYPLRLKLRYQGENWLFFRSVTVKADAQIFELAELDVERDNSGGVVWEWADFALEDHPMLEAWLNAERVVVRFNGDKYYHDLVVPRAQLNQLREVYQAWQAMGGKP